MRKIGYALLAAIAVVSGGVATDTAVVLVDVAATGVGSANVALNTVTNRIYVANQFSGTVTVVDGADNSVVANVAAGIWPWGVAVDETNNIVYVADFLGTSAQVIDGATNMTLAPIPIGVRSSSVAVDETAGRVYFGSSISGRIAVVDTSTHAVLVSLNVSPLRPADLVADPPSQRVYFVDFSQVFGYVDTTDHSITSTTLPGFGLRLGLDASARRIYVPTAAGLVVFDADSLAQLDLVPSPSATLPAGVEVNPGLDRVYVALRADDELAVYDGSSLALLAIVPAGSTVESPLDVAVNPVTGRIYTSLRTASGGPDGGVAVHADGSAEQLAGILLDQIEGLAIPAGLSRSLASKANAALALVEDSDAAALGALGALENAIQAQAGKKIPDAEAAELLQVVETILGLIDC